MLKKSPPPSFLTLSLTVHPRRRRVGTRFAMKLPIWHTWFAADFYVVYDFPATPGGRLPYYYYDTDKNSNYWIPPASAMTSPWSPRGRIKSANIAAGGSKCVSLAPVAEGKPFFVYVQTRVFTGYDVCSTHSSNPEKWYYQTNRPYRQLWYKSTGAAGAPQMRIHARSLTSRRPGQPVPNRPPFLGIRRALGCN